MGSRVVGEGLGGVKGLGSGVQTWWDGWMDGWIEFLTSIVDTVNTKAKQYQECETLITRIEVRIMRF